MKRFFAVCISCALVFVFWMILFKKPGVPDVSEIQRNKRLPSKYLISFGNPEAPIKIIEYFSFACPHCLTLFRTDFKPIRENFIEKDLVFWTFHPVPMDVVTVQAMDCLEKLSDERKRIILEAYLEEAEAGDPEICTLILMEAMKVFGNPLPRLGDNEHLESTQAFSDAFNFVKENPSMNAVPSLEVNGLIHDGNVPGVNFVREIVLKNRGNL